MQSVKRKPNGCKMKQGFLSLWLKLMWGHSDHTEPEWLKTMMDEMRLWSERQPGSSCLLFECLLHWNVLFMVWDELKESCCYRPSHEVRHINWTRSGCFLQLPCAVLHTVAAATGLTLRWSRCSRREPEMIVSRLFPRHVPAYLSGFNEMPCIGCISPFLHSFITLEPSSRFFSSSMSTLTFISFQSLRLSLSLTLLSPLLPVVPSQTNGAHYNWTKNSTCCQVYSPPSECSFFLFLVPPWGGKWVMGRGFVSSFISWQPMCSPLCYQGQTTEAVWPQGSANSPGCRSVIVPAMWPWNLGHKVRINQWSVFMAVGITDITLW